MPKHVKVILTEVVLNEDGEPFISEATQNPYYLIRVKQGSLGKVVTRTMWGNEDEDGNVKWDRASPKEVMALKGQDLAGELEVVSTEIEPQTFVTPDGTPVEYNSRAFVRFADETLEQAVRRSGSKLPLIDEDTDAVEDVNTESIVA